jgi:hypothetical protein
MPDRLHRLRALLDDLEPELLAWEQKPDEPRRKRSWSLANDTASELQAIINSLRFQAKRR